MEQNSLIYMKLTSIKNTMIKQYKNQNNLAKENMQGAKEIIEKGLVFLTITKILKNPEILLQS